MPPVRRDERSANAAPPSALKVMEQDDMTTGTSRRKVHTRRIECRAFRRDDGLFEIEADLSDEKGQQVDFRTRPPVAPGQFMHRMGLTLVIDDEYTIREARASTQTAPWPSCGGTDADYAKLVGLRIGPGFSQRMKELLGGVRGCTHLTELVAQAANTYMQASWPDRIARQMAVSQDPLQWPDRSTLGFVDHCHAWRADGPTLAQEYPELAGGKE